MIKVFDFCEFLCTRGHENWAMSDFCEVSCTRGHENWRKLKHLILVTFRVPGVQRYTDRVLQTIQMKLILLWVWAERAVLGRAKTALKFKYEI